MQIQILEGLEGAKRAKGLTVILDVFRACSVAAYVMHGGADKIIPVGQLEAAYQLKQNLPSSLLIGERCGRPPAGFDFGNSPAEIASVDLRGKTVIQTTGAGTQGLVHALGASEVIPCSFPTADTTIAYIRFRQPELVSLVAMGTRGVVHSDEDSLCAEYIQARLLDNEAPISMEAIRAHLRGYPSAQKFFDEEAVWAPALDFDLCLPLQGFPFLLKLFFDPTTNRKVIRKVDGESFFEKSI